MFGDGSDGALHLTSGTTLLDPTNYGTTHRVGTSGSIYKPYQYTTVQIDSGATLGVSHNTGGIVLAIYCTQSFILNTGGNINTICDTQPYYGDETMSLLGDSTIYHKPVVGAAGNGGGSGGFGGGLGGYGFGGGGRGGAANGAAGGTGGDADGTPANGPDGTYIEVTTTTTASGGAADGTSGGGGAGKVVVNKSSTADGNPFGQSGWGGIDWDVNGGDANGSNWGSFNDVLAGGGGGAGGVPGGIALHLIIKAPQIILNGTINTSGGYGANGGYGGTAYNYRTHSGFTLATGGAGGGGGGGGSAGNIYLLGYSTTDSSTKYMFKGLGGLAGAGGGGGGGAAGSGGGNGADGNDGLLFTTVIPSGGWIPYFI